MSPQLPVGTAVTNAHGLVTEYAYDIMGRAVPDVKDYIFIGPFSFANASEIFAEIPAPDYSILIGCIITVIALAAAYITYLRRDLNV